MRDVCPKFENLSIVLQDQIFFFENPMRTHKCEMVTGTKGKRVCVWLVFLAQLAKISRLDLWAVGWWENLWENSTSRKAWPPLLPWKLQFHNCCFRTYRDLGILFPHSLKITNKAEVPRHQRAFLLLFHSQSQRIVNDMWLYHILVSAPC